MQQTDFKIRLRKAKPGDLSLLKHWDKQPHVIEAIPDEYWNWELELKRNPTWREYLIAELNGRPIGFIQIIDPAEEETHYWGNAEPNLRAIDIWIGEEGDLGKGYGTVMMKLTLERCFNDKKVNAVLIDPLESNKKAHKFYERLGFKFVEKRKFGKDKCFVYRLTREDWNSIFEIE